MINREDQLQALLDREAIRDLPLRYCDCVWRGDIDGLLKLFTKDGAFVMDHDGTQAKAIGQSAMRKLYRQGFAIGPRPFIHNHVITLGSPTTASGRCYLDLHSIQQNMQFIGAGYYADDYVKVRGAWKFQQRHFTAIRMDAPPLPGAVKKKAGSSKTKNK